MGLSQRNKSTGKPESGWLLYLYAAGTSTPVTAYKDTGLTAGQEHPNPIVADASGTCPAFWLADGSYRVRGTSSNAGTIFFDLPSVLALGASSGGGGGGDTTDPNALLQTGDPIWRLITGSIAGFVRMNGRTIGSATSGASERANADCQNLHGYLWNNLSDTVAGVGGGRGVSAAADWTANKTIIIPSMRDMAAFGLDDMGNTALAGFTGVTFAIGNSTTVGSTFGAATKALAIANMPAHDHSTPTASTSPQTAIQDGSGGNVAAPLGSSANTQAVLGSGANFKLSSVFINPIVVPQMTLSIGSQGSGTAFDKMNPGRLGTWYMKI